MTLIFESENFSRRGKRLQRSGWGGCGGHESSRRTAVSKRKREDSGCHTLDSCYRLPITATLFTHSNWPLSERSESGNSVFLFVLLIRFTGWQSSRRMRTSAKGNLTSRQIVAGRSFASVVFQLTICSSITHYSTFWSLQQHVRSVHPILAQCGASYELAESAAVLNDLSKAAPG